MLKKLYVAAERAAVSVIMSVWTYCALIFFMVSYAASMAANLDADNTFAVITHIIIGWLCLSLVWKSYAGFVLQTIGIFSLIAFCCFPILELILDVTYWDGKPLGHWERLYASTLIALFLGSLNLGSRFMLQIPFQFRNVINQDFEGSRLVLKTLWVANILLLFSLLALFDFNLFSLLFRGGALHTAANVDSTAGWAFVEFFLRPLIFNLGIFLFFASDSRFLKITGLMIGLAGAFPTAIPRFLAAALVMPFIMHWLFRSLMQIEYAKALTRFPPALLPNLLLLGLFFIFPLLDFFRIFSLEDDFEFAFLSRDVMLAGHFDSFQMFVRAIEHGQFLGGYGLLGAALFFVPRSIWSGKPEATAHAIAYDAELSWMNVSMPFVAEMFLNFWIVGVILGGVILGLSARTIDAGYSNWRSYRPTIKWFIYFQLIGLTLYVLRGSLLSATAHATGVVASWVVIALILLCLSSIGRHVNSQIHRR